MTTCHSSHRRMERVAPGQTFSFLSNQMIMFSRSIFELEKKKKFIERTIRITWQPPPPPPPPPVAALWIPDFSPPPFRYQYRRLQTINGLSSCFSQRPTVRLFSHLPESKLNKDIDITSSQPFNILSVRSNQIFGIWSSRKQLKTIKSIGINQTFI